MELQIEIVGAIMIVLALLHIPFPRYFRWSQDLKGVSLVNRQMMYIHTFFIGLVLLMMGILCMYSSEELLGTHLGHYILIGLALFWSFRLLIQFVGFSPALWRGKRFETAIHILFSLLWGYFVFVFWAAFSSWK